MSALTTLAVADGLDAHGDPIGERIVYVHDVVALGTVDMSATGGEDAYGVVAIIVDAHDVARLVFVAPPAHGPDDDL